MVDLKKLKRNEFKKTFSIKISPKTLQEFQLFCKTNNIFLGELVGELMKEFLIKYKKGEA